MDNKTILTTTINIFFDDLVNRVDKLVHPHVGRVKLGGTYHHVYSGEYPSVNRDQVREFRTLRGTLHHAVTICTKRDLGTFVSAVVDLVTSWEVSESANETHALDMLSVFPEKYVIAANTKLADLSAADK